MNRTANAAQAQRWNGESGRYWIAHRERLLAAHRRLIPHLLSAAGISPGERILDVGCGCGGTTITAGRAAGGGEFAGFAPGGFAVGLDLSGPMLEVARGIAAQAGVTNVRFVQGDAQTCPLRRDSCDVLISSFGVMFFEDPALAFARLAAALSAGGRLAFLCWQQGPQNEIFAIPLNVFGAYTQLPGSAADLFGDPGHVKDLLSGSGWANVEIDAVNELAWLGSDVADVMSYVRGMSIVRSLTAALEHDALAEQALAAIAGEYAMRRQPGGIWVRAAAWLVTARRA